LRENNRLEERIKEDKPGGAYSTHGKFIEYSVRNSKGEVTTLEIRCRERMLLKWIINSKEVRSWTGLIFCKYGTVTGCFQ